MAKNETSFTEDDDRASEAGKISRRGLGLKTIKETLLELLSDNAPLIIEKQFEAKGIKLTDKTLWLAYHMSGILNAIKGVTAERREINDRLEGKSKETVEHQGNLGIELKSDKIQKILKKLDESSDKSD